MAATKKAAPRGTTKAAEQAAETTFTAANAFTEAAQDQYEKAMKSFSDNAEQFRAQAEETAATLRESFETAQERFSAVNADFVEAARTEVSDAVEFTNELARAKTVTDAFEIQRAYWTKLFDTRIERTRALTEATTAATRDAFEPLTKSMTTAFGAASFEKFFPSAAK
ncbi:MAG: phasin family protein [Parvularculaceae bacterium]